MKFQYEKGDKVIVTSNDVYAFEVGDVVTITEVDLTAFAVHDQPYKVTGNDGNEGWFYDYEIEPATVSLLCKWNETEITAYIDMVLEDENKKCLEFLAKNPSEYFTPEEIAKNAKISFTSLNTLKRELIHQSELPYWKCEELGYEVTYKLKPNKKKYYGDDGSVLFRGKSEHYFCAVKKVKEVYNDDEEECGEDE